MRSDQVFALLRRAAQVTGRTEFVIIGSQAIHGEYPDPRIQAVELSQDMDVYSTSKLSPPLYEELLIQLGQDSDYHQETNTYLEPVSETLARFPEGWQDRAHRLHVGSVEVNGKESEVTAIFPEIHDLTVSKLAIFRDKDRAFLHGVVDEGLVDQDTLRDRYRTAPRITDERLIEGLTEITDAFDRKHKREHGTSQGRDRGL
jgi:hypothetical protein